MNLLLRIAGPNVTQDVPVSSSAETTLGRDASADVVLPDPDKWISRKHLAVRQTAEGIELRVVSTVNGVDTSRGPVERGQRISLVVGDHFTLGPYRIDVALGSRVAMAAAAPLGATAAPFPPPSFGADDPFAALLGGGGSHRAIERNDDPFARPEFQPAARPAARDDKDPFGELLGLGGSGKRGNPEPLAPGGIGMGEPRIDLTGTPVDSNAQLNDWLGAGGGGRASTSDAGSGPLDAFLGRGAPVAPRALSPDHVHGIHMPLSFGPPSAPAAVLPKPVSAPSESPSNSPPPDVWADLQGLAFAPIAPPAVLAPPAPAGGVASDSAARPLPSDNPFRNIDISIEDDAFSEWISTEPMPPNFERAFEDTGPPSISKPGGHKAPASASASESAATPKSPDVVAPSAGQAGSWAAFARGLGLPPTHPSDEASAERAGGMVKLLLEGLADLLSARADLKRELRAEDRTMLSGRDNNPLKLKLSPAELVQYLFAAQAAGGYMPAERAVRESITELRVHEHATIAAARAAVEGALRDFEPGRLKKQLVKGKPGMFQMLDNAKLWDAYQQNYEKQSEHMADWLETLFNRHFMPTYSRETERLKMQAADGAEGKTEG